MRVGLLRLNLFLHGCRSLKEKRQRVGGLRDRFGRQVNVSVCESQHADSLQRAEWSFVASAGDGVIVERIFSDIERAARGSLDAELLDADFEWLV